MRHRIVAVGVTSALVLVTAVPAVSQSSQLGQLEFPNSGEPAAQGPFIRGVLLLHSFEYDDAAEAFRTAQERDPDFAMAYWGEAMTYNHPLWRQQDREAALTALSDLGSTAETRADQAGTERERRYLEAVEILYGEGDKFSRDEAYADAMRRLHEAYPEDDEAKLFYALAILGTAHEGRDFATYMRAAALAEEVFRDNPRHPGAAHYLIHSYDDPIHAPLGLRPARAYSEIAPAASHAQHMTSHIFMALGMWDDVISANETAWRVADARVERKGLPSDARNFHALRWLAYGYLQQGRYERAREMLAIMKGDAERSDSPRARSYLAGMRADYVANTTWASKGVAKIEVDLRGLGAATAAGYRFATALTALQEEDLDLAQRLLNEMRMHREERERRHSGDYPPSLQAARVMEMELQALIQKHSGDEPEALRVLREAAALEASMPYEFGPPDVVKPSHELLGEVLLDLNRPEDAREAFEAALERAPGRTLSLWGLARAAERSGDTQRAQEARAKLQRNWREADDDVRQRLQAVRH